MGKKKNDVKVYENTEEVTADHEEASMTAIITSMDMENNQMHFVSVLDGTDITLQYHGGVRVTDTTGADIGIDNVACGMSWISCIIWIQRSWSVSRRMRR